MIYTVKEKESEAWRSASWVEGGLGDAEGHCHHCDLGVPTSSVHRGDIHSASYKDKEKQD